MFLNLNDKGLSRTLILFGERELDHKIILEKVLKKNMKILDIGSNIGYYLLIERNLIGRNSKIIAVEPVPDNINLLKKNLKVNNEKSTSIIEGAVSNKNGYETFYTSEHFNLGTFHFKGTSKKMLDKKSKIKVKTFKLIDICIKECFPDLIRMDVEGHETKILENLLKNKKKFIKLPLICFETHISKYDKNNSMEKILNGLFAIGYKVKLASSSSIRGTNFLEKKFSYKPISMSIKTDEEVRNIYKNIRNKDAIKLICKTGGLRTVLLSAE
jgi:FkbM family methyltransferase